MADDSDTIAIIAAKMPNKTIAILRVAGFMS
jgi:hypothetical protein